MRLLGRFALLLASTLISACAGPQLQVPKAPQSSVELERQRQIASLRDQQDIAFLDKIDQWRRVYKVYSRLRVQDAEICGQQTAPFCGVWLGDDSSFSSNDADRGKRLLKLGSQVTVLEVASNGAAAGLHAGDGIIKIGDVVLKQQETRQKSQLTVAAEALKKVGERPANIEFERDGTKYTTQLKSVSGLSIQSQFDRAKDAERILGRPVDKSPLRNDRVCHRRR